MKKFFLSLLASIAVCTGASAFEGSFYAGAGACAVLPQNSSSMRNLTGAAFNFGWYVTDRLALEADVACLEHECALSCRALCHMGAWEEFDLLFGCERFDPFITIGASVWIDTPQYGPSLGIGAFYYLSDFWALRFDASAALGLEDDPSMVYGVSLGVTRTF